MGHRRRPTRAEVVTRGAPAPRYPWIGWLTSGDHKRVGVIMIGTALSILVITLATLVLLRLQLAVSDNTLVGPDAFNQLLTVFATSGFFFMLLPLAAGLAIYVVPLQVGSRTIAFPRLGQLSVWLFLLGAVVLFGSLLWDNPSQAGFSAPPPLSSDDFLEAGVNSWLVAVALASLGALCAAVSVLVTVHRLRAPGMNWRRVPIFATAATVAAWLVLIASPVLMAALTMLFADRNWGASFFEPSAAGYPVMWQLLFWFGVVPMAAAAVLTAFGAISEIVPVFSRRPPWSHGATSVAFIVFGCLALVLWMVQVQTAPISVGYMIFGMVVAALMLIPLAMIFTGWIRTMWGGALSLRAPMRLALVAISLLSVGLAAQLMLAVVPVAWALDKSTFATAAGWYLLGGVLVALLAGLAHWFPKMTGRTLSDALVSGGSIAIGAGAHVALVPLAVIGLDGAPPDIYKYFEADGWQTAHLISTAGVLVFVAGVLVVLGNVAWSRERGMPAGHDPWGGRTLEWFALSPPPEHNFDAIPDVLSGEPLLDIRAAVAARTRAAAIDRAGVAAGAGERAHTPASSSVQAPETAASTATAVESPVDSEPNPED